MKKAIVAVLSTLVVSSAFAASPTPSRDTSPFNYEYMRPDTFSDRTFGTDNVYTIANPDQSRAVVLRDYDWAKANGFVTTGELDYPPNITKSLVSIYPNLTGIYDASIYTESGSL